MKTLVGSTTTPSAYVHKTGGQLTNPLDPRLLWQQLTTAKKALRNARTHEEALAAADTLARAAHGIAGLKVERRKG